MSIRSISSPLIISRRLLYLSPFLRATRATRSVSLLSPASPRPQTQLQTLHHWLPKTQHLQLQHQFRTMASATSFYDFKPLDKKGNAVDLAPYKGKVVLVVNTASKCGFTPQYEGLEKLYNGIKEKHGDDFAILGFPCNQFGGQEPGSNDDIQNFCLVNYGVTFTIMGKTDVNGSDASPLFEWLKTEQPGLLGLKRVKWNFEKWLIGKDGKVTARWASTTKPESLEKAVIEQLAK